MILKKNFFKRSTVQVAKDLLGMYLVRKYRGVVTRNVITEVEAYDGYKDKASHASRGRTKRNEVMFRRGGFWYVYFIYGMYWMLNIVTQEEGYPAAILIRETREVRGPGRLTRALRVRGEMNGKPISRKTGLWIEIPKRKEKIKIKRLPRVGVEYAGSIWSKKAYRFQASFMLKA